MKYFHRPVQPFYLTQPYGANRACVEIGGTKVISCDGHNPPDGYKSLYGKVGHTGIDLVARHGQEIYCAQAGYIKSIDTNPRTGLDVRIQSEIGGRTFLHIYEHLLGYQGKKGDWVETGQLVGWADNTGWSSGDHLHFGVKELIDGEWVYIDPMEYMSDLFAPNVLKVNHTLAYLKEQVAKLADTLADYLRRRNQ